MVTTINYGPRVRQYVQESGALPYYALSRLLTAFSHDVPTLPLIQHIFDYVLARPPIVLIYLTAAVRPLCGTHLVYLCRKDEVSKSYRPGLTKTAGNLAKPDWKQILHGAHLVSSG
jgi:hypothetical protein